MDALNQVEKEKKPSGRNYGFYDSRDELPTWEKNHPKLNMHFEDDYHEDIDEEDEVGNGDLTTTKNDDDDKDLEFLVQGDNNDDDEDSESSRLDRNNITGNQVEVGNDLIL